MVYLLILLLNNDTTQVYQLFESQEVYVCVIASFLIFEVNRYVITLFKKFEDKFSEWGEPLIVVITNCLFSSVLASATLFLYFKIWVGFSPGQAQLWVFITIYVVVSLLYFTLYFSHSLLSRENTVRLANEQLVKESIANEFEDFKNDINPMLLYSSLERIITLSYENPDKAEELIDYLSSVYRYLLGHKQTELVELEEEIMATDQLVNLLNTLPEFNVMLEVDLSHSDIQLIPGTITSIVEDIAKRTINNPKEALVINCYKEDEYLVIQHQSNYRLSMMNDRTALNKSQRAYSYYTDTPIIEVSAYNDCYTKIPILTLEKEMAKQSI
jgi:hypothetical protein